MQRYILSKASIKFYFLLVPVTVISLIFSVQSCSDVSAKSQNVSPPSLIDGAWNLVWAKYNGIEQDMSKMHLFKMFHDGIFSLIATDSSGKISFAGYGKFELDGNTYYETFMYHDNPAYIGASDWQEYELDGDTLYMKGFNKVLINGKDSTASFPKIEEKRVRIKKKN